MLIPNPVHFSIVSVRTRVTVLSVMLLSCAGVLSAPVFAQNTILSNDPEWRRSVEQIVESYIRAHPEMIEQTLQALKATRQADEQASMKRAIGAHQSELLNDPASPVSGDPAGDVTVVEFFDYRCGYCKRAAGSVAQLQRDDARVRIVYKDFPILGDGSVQATKAALASRAQGRYQEFHEAVLAAKGDLTKEHLLQIASEVGLDSKKLRWTWRTLNGWRSLNETVSLPKNCALPAPRHSSSVMNWSPVR